MANTTTGATINSTLIEPGPHVFSVSSTPNHCGSGRTRHAIITMRNRVPAWLHGQTFVAVPLNIRGTPEGELIAYVLRDAISVSFSSYGLGFFLRHEETYPQSLKRTLLALARYLGVSPDEGICVRCKRHDPDVKILDEIALGSAIDRQGSLTFMIYAESVQEIFA